MRNWGSNSSPLTDQEMLQALVRDSRLTDKERKAFEGMLKTAAGGRKLSDIQRSWAHDTSVKYELDKSVQGSLVSEGLVPRWKEVKLPYEDLPRPTKPPGRK